MNTGAKSCDFRFLIEASLDIRLSYIKLHILKASPMANVKAVTFLLRIVPVLLPGTASKPEPNEA